MPAPSLGCSPGWLGLSLCFQPYLGASLAPLWRTGRWLEALGGEEASDGPHAIVHFGDSLAQPCPSPVY